MKLSGQEGNQEGNTAEIEPRTGDTSGNGSSFAAASESESLAIERSDSEKPRTSEGSPGSPAPRATGPRTPGGKQRSRRNALKHGIFSGSVLLKGESRAEYNSLFDGLVETFVAEGKLGEVLVEKLATDFWRHRRLLQAEVAEIRKGVDFLQSEQQTRDQREVQEIDRSLSLNCQYGLISKIDNPLILKRCLVLLDGLRALFAQKGFTKIDPAILKDLYGDGVGGSEEYNLYMVYRFWLIVFEISEDKRLAHGFESPEQCKAKVLRAIDKEIRRLKKYQKAQTAMESERLKVEALRRAVPESPALDRLLRYQVNLERSIDRTLTQLERLQRMRLGHPVLPPINLNVSSS